MKRVHVIIVPIALLATVFILALTLTSCAADPPRIAIDDVVDFGVGPADTADNLYHPSQPLDPVRG